MTATTFRRVLVGWDCSANSAAALRTAVSMTGEQSPHVVALAVLHGMPHGEASEDCARELADRRQHTKRLFGQVRDSVPADAQARVSLHIIEDDDAARALCDYAAEHGFDLLVLGGHGDGVLRRRLGRVAEAAARTGKVPVLLLDDR